MNLKAEIEALLFASDQPLSMVRFQEVLPAHAKDDIESALAELEQDYQDEARAFRLLRIAGGFQLATKQEFSAVVRRLFVGKRRVRLTKAALETLAIIAYKQPTTRPEVDAIRGVSSGGVLETLLERNLVRIAGRAEGVGRPLLYATTGEFLQYLGLNRLNDLPSLEELEALLTEREEEMRREEEEELRAAAAAVRDHAGDEVEAEPVGAATLEDKLRERNLPTLDELDTELGERRTAIEDVAARVKAERTTTESNGDAEASTSRTVHPDTTIDTTTPARAADAAVEAASEAPATGADASPTATNSARAATSAVATTWPDPSEPDTDASTATSDEESSTKPQSTPSEAPPAGR